MNERNLPIRFFSMREKDERMTEGAEILRYLIGLTGMPFLKNKQCLPR